MGSCCMVMMMRLLLALTIFYYLADAVKDSGETERKQNDVNSKKAEYRKGTKPMIDFTSYHRAHVISGYLKKLSLAYPKIVQLMTIGQSFEGRDLTVIKIGNKSKSCNPAIWVDAGIHGNEMIGPAVALYLIDQLTNNYETNRFLVDNVDWYILPLVNPDGYEYSSFGDREWRKTRSRNPNSHCIGVDANRNFAFHHDDESPFSSPEPCSDVYIGPKAMSEPEVQALGNFLMERKDQLIMYVTMHAYSQMILIPWGYTEDLPEDYDELYSLALNASKALTAVHGTKYKVGPTTQLLYLAPGGSDDYAKGAAGIKYSYTVELRDKGEYGFNLPEKQILPTGEETWELFKYFGKAVSNMSNEYC